MQEIVFESVPTYRRNDETIPLLAAYALTGDRTCSVFLLNRKMSGKHGGTDFGDGATPVTLNLPFRSVKKLTLHRIARTDGTPADPRDNNLVSRKVSILSEGLPTNGFDAQFVVNARTGATAEGLPPGAIYLYVFEW